MKLLLDQNLSARLLSSLEASFPGTTHVRVLELERADDRTIWELAAAEDFIVVSKDTDFYQRSILFGHPPKVVWIALGNCTTTAVKDLLLSSIKTIEAFHADAEQSFLVLGAS